MRWVLLLTALLGCRKSQVEVRPDDKKSGPPRVTCTLPEPIATTTVPARCDLTINKTIKVPAGVTITVEKGAKITFASKESGLAFEGGVLHAEGTADEPIVFTSATKAPGASYGLGFIDRPLAAAAETGTEPPCGHSIVQHVTVEFARGLVVAPRRKCDTVAISNVKVAHNEGDDLRIVDAEAVTKLENVQVADGTVSIPFSLLPALGQPKNTTVRLHDSITASLKMPKLDKPYVIERGIDIRAKATPIALEIADGTVVQFGKSPLARVFLDGTGVEAKLVAHQVTFTSADPTPKAGDWSGLVFLGDVAVDVDNCVIEYSGGAFSAGGVFRVPSMDKKTRVVNTTFRNNALPAFESDNCKKWEDPSLKNTSTGKTMCDESPLMKSFSKIGSIGVLGTLGTGSSSLGSVFGPGSKWGDESLGGIVAGPGGYGGLGGAGGGIGGGGAIAKTTKVTESSITASGALPVDVVRKRVRASTGSLRACHSGASGSLTVSFSIDDKGSVTSAKVSGGSITSESVRSCVAGVFNGMTFPAPDPPGTTSATATHNYSED
jgi:hypothetical protein